jgi:predicted outer membrane protein
MEARPVRLVRTAGAIVALLPLLACGTYPTSPATATTGLSTASTVDPAPEQADTGTRLTKWGPLSQVDRELLKKVRLATLWEMTMAQEATQRAHTPRVRQISAEIAAQHETLDEEARSLAKKLDVRLPVRPTVQQQDWMSDITGRTGIAYDSTYVKWLRLAHGQVFALIGTVRGSTQNTLVRRFSEHANAAVLNHQRLLESTGLTTPASFPSPPAS